MPHAYTEDHLVEQPAIGLFAKHGWSKAGPPPNVAVGGAPREAGLLRWETKGEVVRVLRLRPTCSGWKQAAQSVSALSPNTASPRRVRSTIWTSNRDVCERDLLAGWPAKENMSSPSLVRYGQVTGQIWAGRLVTDVH